MNHRNRKSTSYSTAGEAIGSCIISSNGPFRTWSTRAGTGSPAWKCPGTDWRSTARILWSNTGIGVWNSGVQVKMTRMQFGHFICALVFLLFSSDSISAWYKWHQYGIYHLPMEVEFHRVPNPPNGGHWDVPMGCWTMALYQCICGVIVSFLVSLFFFSLIYWLWQSRRSVPREGDNLMATCDLNPGKCHYIFVAAETVRSVSNILALYCASIHTRSCVPLYTISFVCSQA